MVLLSQSARVRPARAEGSRRLSTREPAVPRSAIHRPSYSRILTAESHLAAAAEDARPWPLFSAGTAEHCLCRANTAWHSLTITVARSSSSSSSSALAPVQRSVLSHGIASRTVFICCMPCCLVDVYAVVHVSCLGTVQEDGMADVLKVQEIDQVSTPVAVGYKPHLCARTAVACVHVRPMTKASCAVRMPIGTLRSAFVECCEEQPLIDRLSASAYEAADPSV